MTIYPPTSIKLVKNELNKNNIVKQILFNNHIEVGNKGKKGQLALADIFGFFRLF